MFIPIYPPPDARTSRFGTRFSYAPMNPALWVNPDGTYVLLVRAVNYRKFCDGSFTIYENQSASIYYVARGHIDTLGSDTYTPLRIDYGAMRRYSTYWAGVEDLRFIDEGSVVAAVPELTPGGHPSLFRASLDGPRLHTFLPLPPNTSPQKNWMPYGDAFVYQVSPLTLRVDGALVAHPADTSALDQYHGSTNGVRNGEGWLFLIHRGKEHRWMKIDGASVSVSSPFSFLPNSHIEFCCSLAAYGDDLYIGLGVNDEAAYVVRVARASVPPLKPLPAR